MIEKIEMSGNGYRIEEPFKKYAGFKKDVVAKIVVAEIGKSKGEKYEISVAMDIPGGKVIAARDECSNVFAGVDLVEAKLLGQIRRYKLEMQPHRQKKSLRSLFIKRK